MPVMNSPRFGAMTILWSGLLGGNALLNDVLRELVEERDVFAAGELLGVVGDHLAVRPQAFSMSSAGNTEKSHSCAVGSKRLVTITCPCSLCCVLEEGVLLAVGDHRSPPRVRVARRGSGAPLVAAARTVSQPD